MRLAIMSDIHSNLEALTTALKVIDEMSIDEIVCLGDIVGYGASPVECIEMIKDRCAVILQGNHDAAAVDLSNAWNFTPIALAAAQWTHEQLGDEYREFLHGLPLTSSFDHLFFVHSSPHSPEEWNYLNSEIDVMRAFRFFQEQICFVGHTHHPGIYHEQGKATSVDRDHRYIINVGSVGQPRDGNPRLSFGIFDSEKWSFDHVRRAYDIETARKKILEAGLPAALGNRLVKGV